MIRTAVGIVVVALGVAGCGEPNIETMPVTVNGTITVPEGTPGNTVYVRLYHAWALEGALRHPLQFIAGFESAPGSFSYELAYPVDRGEGLVVYAWLDGDAGIAEVAADVELVLTQPCAGPDWFFPAAAD